jgi:YVTN family beta-propeller protein
MRPSLDGRWLYAADMDGTTVQVVDTSSNKPVGSIEVGQGPVQVAFAPDGRFAYVSFNTEDSVAKIDVARQQVVSRIRVGDGSVQTYVTPTTATCSSPTRAPRTPPDQR